MSRPAGKIIPEDDLIVSMILDLIEARKQEGWSQDEVARQMGVTRQAVHHWENFNHPPNPHHLARWGRLFGKKVGWSW